MKIFQIVLLALFAVGKISATEVAQKERLLQGLFFDDGFAYTLFGAKAMSFSCFWDSCPQKTFPFPAQLPSIPDNDGRSAYACWCSIKADFHSSHFFFKESTIYLGKTPVHGLVFVNKQKFLEVVEENLQRFQRILGKSCTAQKLLSEMETSSRSFLEILNYHEGLFGILLGYGPHNSFFFHQRSEYLKQLDQPVSPPFLEKPLPFIAKGTASKSETKKMIYEMMQPFTIWNRDAAHTLFFLKPPQFAVLESKETARLVKQYKKAHEEISAHFINKKLQEVLAEQLQQ